MTSLPDKPHVERLRRDPRVGVVVDEEEPERTDGERPNRQVRAVGVANLSHDTGGVWTRRITEKYLNGPGRASKTDNCGRQRRVLIKLWPTRLVAVASV